MDSHLAFELLHHIEKAVINIRLIRELDLRMDISQMSEQEYHREAGVKPVWRATLDPHGSVHDFKPAGIKQLLLYAYALQAGKQERWLTLTWSK